MGVHIRHRLEDGLYWVIDVNDQDVISSRTVDDGRVAEVLDYAGGRVADPTVFVRNLGPFRDACFDQRADLIAFEIADDFLANGPKGRFSREDLVSLVRPAIAATSAAPANA